LQAIAKGEVSDFAVTEGCVDHRAHYPP
jgi:hypothetical protein